MTETLSPGLLFDLWRRRGETARKRLGQHFLADEPLLERIADAAGADARTLAVEIGPGPATLTTLLASRAGGIIAIERDERLRSFHEQFFGTNDRIEFLYADALRVDLWAVAREAAARWGLERVILTGNLPFQITSPLLFGQTGPGQPWARMAVMIQREVADRIAAPPGNRAYGILTVKLGLGWRVADRFEVPAARFFPPPKVDAAVLALEPVAPGERVSDEAWPGLSKFIDLAFNQRRKKLYNSPATAMGRPGGREAMRAALVGLGLNPETRPEGLAPGEFVKLYGRFVRGGD